MHHRRSTTFQNLPPGVRKRSIIRMPSDNLLYASDPFASENLLNARQRNKDIKLKLRVTLKQSITSLVDELERDELCPCDLATKTEDLRVVASNSLREHKDWSRESTHAYRDILALKLSETHENLDKLIWDMQDALDQIVSESQKQIDCLDEIEDLFDFVKNPKSGHKRVDRLPLPIEERHVEDPLSTEAVSPVPHFSLSSQLRTVTTADKGCQCSEFVEDTFSLALLESRHCQYMFDVFSHLRFVLDILSPLEIERPDKSKFVPELNSKSNSEHRLRIKGTLFEINSQMVEISVQPRFRSPSLLQGSRYSSSKGSAKMGSSPQSAASPEPGATSLRPPLTQSKLLKEFVVSKVRGATLGVPIQESIQVSMHLRLKTVDPYLMQQTRPLPQFFQASTKVKYAEIERIQMMMPEVADIRFNISDVLRPEMKSDEFYVNSYFMMGKKDKSEATMVRVEQDVSSALLIYQFLLRRKSYFRILFLSYNVESLTCASDMLAMNFATFIRLLKDCLLISPTFDLLAAARVYYLSAIKSKELPESGDEIGQRKWFKHLLNSYNFKTNYRLKLSGFIESIVRLTFYHPRFTKLTHLRPSEKLALLYKRNLKPNARLTQSSFYSTLLRDIHISAVLVSFESSLYEIFQGYMSRLTVSEKLSDFIGKDKKIDLLKYYSFLASSGILVESDIVTTSNEDIEEEIDELNDLHHGEDAREKHATTELRKNQALHVRVKYTGIRFPSSMLDKTENKNIILRASRNMRQTGSGREVVLLPFYRPVRSELKIDKLTAFSFFICVMKSIDGVFHMSSSNLCDSDFCINFKEFCDLVGMLGLLYWKSVTKCLEMSMVEGVASFIRMLLEKFRYMREFLGMTQAERDRLTVELLKQTTGPIESIQLKPMLTKTMLAQERFLQRRDSI